MAWAPDYATVAGLAEEMRIDDDLDDAKLARAITAGSRAVDDTTNRQFGQTDAVEERLYVPRYDYERRRWVVDIDDLMSITDLVVVVDGTTVTNYQLLPLNAAQKGRPWTVLAFTSSSEAVPRNGSEVSASERWGWLSYPGTVVEATLLQSQRFFKRKDAPFGVAGSPQQGSELRLLAKADPDVALMLKGYRRARAVL